MPEEKKLIIFVSSSVYGNEYLLDQICFTLKGYGYEVWASDPGTFPHNSTLSNTDNCLIAVQNCDLFLGLITPFYGSSGNDRNIPSITHLELRQAIKIDKLRWILAHEHVVFARSFLKNLGFVGPDGRRVLSLEKKTLFEDLRIIDMYEESTFDPETLEHRKWVHKFRKPDEVLSYIDSQLSDYDKIKKLVVEKSKNDQDPHDNGNNGDSP
ncbi:MAG: DUF4062 domain-containing protein [Methanoregula sp.]